MWKRATSEENKDKLSALVAQFEIFREHTLKDGIRARFHSKELDQDSVKEAFWRFNTLVLRVNEQHWFESEGDMYEDDELQRVRRSDRLR